MKKIILVIVILFLFGCSKNGAGFKVDIQSEKPLPVNLQKPQEALPVVLEKSGTIPVELNVPKNFPVHLELKEGETLPVDIKVPSNRPLAVEIQIQKSILFIILILATLILILALIVCSAAISIAKNARTTREFFEEIKKLKEN